MAEDETVSSEPYSTLNPEWMHIQLNSYDFYLAKPSILDRHHGNSLPMNQFSKVPVIRLYGFLPTGHQVLCHVHGVFPYIFIPYDGQETDSSATMNQKSAQLHNMLEIKSQLSMIKRKDIKGIKQDVGELKYIANVSVVKGIPFYGFHVGWSLYFKISLLDAGFMNRLSDLIRDGKIFGKPIEVYEAQLPYLLQFSADFNLFGCSWVDFDRCYFRKPVLNSALDLDKLLHNEDLERILEQFCNPDSNILSEKEFPRIGNGLLEIDTIPEFIRNIDDVVFRDLHYDFCEKLLDTSKMLSKPYVTSTKNIIRDIAIQRRILSLERYVPVANLERMEQDTNWQSSASFEKDFQEAKSRLSSGNGVNFNDFVKNGPILSKVKMIRESLDELWPTPPDLSTTSEELNQVLDVIDTMSHEYNAVDMGEHDVEVFVDSQDNQPLGDTSKVGEREKVNYDTINVTKPIRTSMDTCLTQTMAKRHRKKSETKQRITQRRETKRVKIRQSGIVVDRGSFAYHKPSIDYSSILNDMEERGYPKIDYLDPFFGNPLDLRRKPYIYAGKRFEITSTHLSSRIPVPFQAEHIIECTRTKENVFNSWKYLKKPPQYEKVAAEVWKKTSKKFKSQIENPTSKNDTFFKSDTNQQAKKVTLHNSLTHFSVEIHVQTEGSKMPDPKKDEVTIIFWHLEKESYPFDLHVSPIGIMVLKDCNADGQFNERIQEAAGDIPVAFYEDEFDLFDALVDIVLIFDPDILSGFELHSASWGYIIERCRVAHHFEIADEISRVNSNVKNKFRDQWGYSHASAITICGRHMINIWRAIKDDLALNKYTIENISYIVFRQRMPHFSYKSLSQMWRNNHVMTDAKTVISYWVDRIQLNIRLLQKQEYIPRITELSRLTGIDFYSVYYRGSQYKIESILCRLCKAESFVMVAPSRKRVKQQNALECVPLVMEPESAFYKSPLVVLDFQSLYPSIIMAYNYCYSTMLGRVRELEQDNNVIGATEISLPKDLLTLLAEHVSISPNGVAYVKPTIRKSTLAKMLEDILDTRFIVKTTMTDIGGSNAVLRRLLNSRQLALKLIANVTYGYTSASFSGRMPCSDLADSVVQTGRETLEKAIEFIESNADWGAKVVYGDTDSLFVYLPGKSREEAFKIGNQMADEVTKRNPAPITLKFEKVYHPSLLISKKRYVGYMYEKDANQSPVFDAKGIETVRRDGHRAQQKIVEKSIRLLFETQDLSKIKRFVQNEFIKIHLGTVSVQDFCFSKVVKLGSYKSERTAPPGAVVATRLMEVDHRARPQYNERVPYVVVRGSAGQLLRERCFSPEEFVANENFELDSEYYINKTLVPPLERLFNILGINVSEWAFELPRHRNAQSTVDSKNIDMNVTSIQCINCRGEIYRQNSQFCETCDADRRQTTSQLTLRILKNDEKMKAITTVCRTCCYRYSHDASELTDFVASRCNSYDCPVYFGRIKAKSRIKSRSNLKCKAALNEINHW